MNENQITKKDLHKTAWRWMAMSVNTYTYQQQQAGSIVFALGPVLRKIYQKDDDYVASLQNHFNYFNTHPWMANLILGASIAMEEQDGTDAIDAVQSFKVGMMGPLAGVGDSIFWVLIPTIIGSIAGYMALDGSPIGAMVWLILNIAFMVFRIKLFDWGYSLGTQLFTTLGEKINNFTEAISIMGLVVIGALIPSVVKVTTPVEIVFGDLKKSLQTDILDTVIPYFLPIMITLLCYKLVKTGKVSITKLILIILVISMAASAAGVLA